LILGDVDRKVDAGVEQIGSVCDGYGTGNSAGASRSAFGTEYPGLSRIGVPNLNAISVCVDVRCGCQREEKFV